ncbi:MAG: hypothetical protein M3T96_01310 [Acidobacteriota bacterium]|nr:hypothetical protein [Acidobacteriota bacterium]
MKNHLLKLTVFSAAIFFLHLSAVSIFSQNGKPELSVEGFRLGDEATAEAKLKGYSPRYDNDLKQPKYFFYNEYGTQVMALTAYSKERPFLLVGIEVFAVGESYQNKHYQMKGVNSFVSGDGFYIGEKPSATSLIFAIANVTDAKDVIKKLGTPETDEKSEKNVRVLHYQMKIVPESETNSATTDRPDFDLYTAQFKFVKKRLRRFSIALENSQTAKNL